ncbi:MAG: glutamyl-tRNA reductase [Gemmatales bacterium]|nr:MAG: glutamyl-tRNA reductase [Gemmatales bacterium]
MMLLVVGTSFNKMDVSLRERLSFNEASLPRALDEINARYDCETVILSTCNRVELYVGRSTVDSGGWPLSEAETGARLFAEFLAEFHNLPLVEIEPYLYSHHDAEAVRHLFRVVSSLDSLVVGEGQIAGQVKRAYELAVERACVGPLLHALFQHARTVGGRVRSETGIAQGHVSISSLAVDYACQVFDRFDDKTVLVIGAGKMGALTLRHLRSLQPRRILVTNRSYAKAEEVAKECGGKPLPWDQLDEALVQADIVLSTTGAREPIVDRARYANVLPKRNGRAIVILDIAVPRDFDPAIHDGDRTCLFNIDDLKRIRERTLADRRQHIAAAEHIVEQEKIRFLKEWNRRKNGAIITRLTEDVTSKRLAILDRLRRQLDDEISPEAWQRIEAALRLFQNQILHGPISALAENAREHGSHDHYLLDALRKLFRLQD